MKLSGYVLWFCERDGNGIIKGDNGLEYYTDISVTPNRMSLKRNQVVSFVQNEKIKDCRCAIVLKVG